MSKIIEFEPGFTLKSHRDRIAELRVGELIKPESLREELDAHWAKGPGPHGLRWPWSEGKSDFAFGAGQVTVLASDGGVGKTTLTSQIALSLCTGVHVGIVSVEEHSLDTVARLQQQFSNTAAPTGEQTQEFWGKSAHDNIVIYDCPNAITPADAYGAVWAMIDMGCELVIVDNMQSCGCKTDSDQERDFINELNAIAQATRKHILLVHHVRKTGGDADNPRPTRDRVKGNGAITQLVCNVLLLWRNQYRKDLVRLEESGHGERLGPEERKVLNEEPDLELIVSKQRFGPDHWVLGLWDGNGPTFKDERYGQDLKLGRALEL
jgi:replicative DNA helicase